MTDKQKAYLKVWLSREPTVGSTTRVQGILSPSDQLTLQFLAGGHAARGRIEVTPLPERGFTFVQLRQVK